MTPKERAEKKFPRQIPDMSSPDLKVRAKEAATWLVCKWITTCDIPLGGSIFGDQKFNYLIKQIAAELTAAYTENERLREALQIAEEALVNCIPFSPHEGDGPLVKIRALLTAQPGEAK